MNQVIVHNDDHRALSSDWQVLDLPQILAILGLGNPDGDDDDEKCPIWTLG